MRFCPTCHSIYTAQVDHCGIDGTRLAETDEDSLIGLELGRYIVEERLGVGANGAVYRVRHRFLGHRYAMKVLFGDLGANRRVVERFRREARAASLIMHPNVVLVTDFGTTDRGLTFMVMELLEGETLERCLHHQGPLAATRVVRLVAQLASGLAAAHDKGFVHRDIKPSNVMLRTQSGVEAAKILDFGVVGLAESASDPRITGEGHFVGTPLYMAPEQARQPETVRPSSDLYALGVLTFEMLNGHPPFNADSVVDLMIKHAQEPVPTMPDAQGLELLVEWLMDKRPERRPTSAHVVVEELERLATLMAAPVERAVARESGREAALVSPETLEMGPPTASQEIPLAALGAERGPDAPIEDEPSVPGPLTELREPGPRRPSGLPGGPELSFDFLRGRLDALEAQASKDDRRAARPAWRLRVNEVKKLLRPGLTPEQYDALAQRIEQLEDALSLPGKSR